MVHDHTIAMRYKLIDSNNNAISLIKILLLLGLVVRFTLGKKNVFGIFQDHFRKKQASRMKFLYCVLLLFLAMTAGRCAAVPVAMEGNAVGKKFLFKNCKRVVQFYFR